MVLKTDVDCNDGLPQTLGAITGSKRKRQEEEKEEEGVNVAVQPAAALSDSIHEQCKRRRSYEPEASQLGSEPVPGSNQVSMPHA